MLRILAEALTYDDVSLVPAHSLVLPKDVSLAANLTNTGPAVDDNLLDIAARKGGAHELVVEWTHRNRVRLQAQQFFASTIQLRKPASARGEKRQGRVSRKWPKRSYFPCGCERKQ